MNFLENNTNSITVPYIVSDYNQCPHNMHANIVNK